MVMQKGTVEEGVRGLGKLAQPEVLQVFHWGPVVAGEAAQAWEAAASHPRGKTHKQRNARS